MYQLWVSRNCGLTFIIEAEYSNAEDMKDTLEKLDEEALRWYVTLDGDVCSEYVCKIYAGIFEAIGAIK